MTGERKAGLPKWAQDEILSMELQIRDLTRAVEERDGKKTDEENWTGIEAVLTDHVFFGADRHDSIAVGPGRDVEFTWPTGTAVSIRRRKDGIVCKGEGRILRIDFDPKDVAVQPYGGNALDLIDLRQLRGGQ